MPDLDVKFHAAITPITGQPEVEIGHPTTPITLTMVDAQRRVHTVAAAGSLVLFDRGAAGNYSQGDFFVVIAHGASVLLERKTDGALPNYWLEAMVSGFPYIIPDGACYRDYGSIGGTAYTQFTSGTLAELDTLSVVNNGSASVQITVFICKA